MRKLPITSILANNSKDKETDKKAIVSVLKKHNGIDFTYREIAKLLQWQEPVRVMRRMNEMVNDNTVIISGIKRDTNTNRPCQTYKLSNS